MDAGETVRAMASVRFVSAAIEAAAACLMLGQTLQGAVRINTALGLVGPAIFATVSALGIAGLAGRIPPLRMAFVFVGVALVLVSSRVG